MGKGPLDKKKETGESQLEKDKAKLDIFFNEDQYQSWVESLDQEGSQVHHFHAGKIEKLTSSLKKDKGIEKAQSPQIKDTDKTFVNAVNLIDTEIKSLDVNIFPTGSSNKSTKQPKKPTVSVPSMPLEAKIVVKQEISLKDSMHNDPENNLIISEIFRAYRDPKMQADILNSFKEEEAKYNAKLKKYNTNYDKIQKNISNNHHVEQIMTGVKNVVEQETVTYTIPEAIKEVQKIKSLYDRIGKYLIPIKEWEMIDNLSVSNKSNYVIKDRILNKTTGDIYKNVTTIDLRKKLLILSVGTCTVGAIILLANSVYNLGKILSLHELRNSDTDKKALDKLNSFFVDISKFVFGPLLLVALQITAVLGAISPSKNGPRDAAAMYDLIQSVTLKFGKLTNEFKPVNKRTDS